MNLLQIVQLTIAIAALTMALINFLKAQEERVLLLIIAGLVVLAILISIVGLVV